MKTGNKAPWEANRSSLLDATEPPNAASLFEEEKLKSKSSKRKDHEHQKEQYSDFRRSGIDSPVSTDSLPPHLFLYYAHIFELPCVIQPPQCSNDETFQTCMLC